MVGPSWKQTGLVNEILDNSDVGAYSSDRNISNDYSYPKELT